ncbi:STAS domain-containing protein [Saccharothrix algeriensis]|uniref:Anti-anti-sigma factor n=1 Tax=Saccharothrix algeriensis TaxID=173560 RepID=A0A8T8HVQ1_9PSEU|nr:STAS domain-containing protein [Saccharothrix algeriensis]MBM7814191.1 anti-anti-sigma factor [Saccharothrix algeriensis]QTR02556.1 STAS domain-containing protein [Saccharothrix algeriensis]
MDQPLITVGSSWHDGILLVTVVGEVDMDTVPKIRAALHQPAPAVVLDLDGVTFFGSAGMQLLVDTRNRVPGLAVVATNHPVLRPLEVTGLRPHLPLCPTRATALAHVRDDLRSRTG